MLTVEDVQQIAERLRNYLNVPARRIFRAPANDPACWFRQNLEWNGPEKEVDAIRPKTIDGRVFKNKDGVIYVSNPDEIDLHVYVTPRDPIYSHLTAFYQAVLDGMGLKHVPSKVKPPDRWFRAVSLDGSFPQDVAPDAPGLYMLDGVRSGELPFTPSADRGRAAIEWQGFAFSPKAVESVDFWIWIPKLHQLCPRFRFIYRDLRISQIRSQSGARPTYRLVFGYAAHPYAPEPDDPFEDPPICPLDELLEETHDDPFSEPAQGEWDPPDAGVDEEWDPERFVEESLALLEAFPFLRQGKLLPVCLTTKRPLTEWKTDHYAASESGVRALVAAHGRASLGLGWIPPVGVTVVDTDQPVTGDRETEIKFMRELGYTGPIFQTRRGLHFFFCTPAGVRIGVANRVNTWLGTVDYRVGSHEPKGYIVLPVNDPARRVVQGGEPDPVFLHYPLGRGVEVRPPILAGARNETLFRALCSMRGTGLYEPLVFESVAETLNQRFLSPPLRRLELRTLVRSVMRYPEPVARSIAQPPSEDELDRILKQVIEPQHQANEPAVRVFSVEELDQFTLDPLFLWMASGQATVIKGPPKTGKTTFVRTLIDKAIKRGLRVAWLCMEEGVSQFAALAARFPQIRRSPRDTLAVCFPNRVQFDAHETLRWALRYALTGYQLLVIDPIGPTCVDPKRPADKSFKNDYDAVYRFILSLRRIADYAGAHLLLIHHTGKGALDTNQSSLGSTAFDAAPDNLVQMLRDDRVHLISRHYGNHEFAAPYDYETGQRDLTELIAFFSGGYNKPDGAEQTDRAMERRGDPAAQHERDDDVEPTGVADAGRPDPSMGTPL